MPRLLIRIILLGCLSASACLAQFPSVSAGGVVNGAGFAPGAAVAPGSIISIFGSNLATAPAAAQALPLPAALGSTTVRINGRAAPLYYVSAGQINAQLPFEITPGAASLEVSVGSATSAPASLSVAATAPGLFLYGGNRAVAQNPGGAINDANNPARPGEVITAYLTGQGQVDNPVATGAPAPASPLSRAVAPASATVGGQPAEILFLGLTPGLAGLLQANIRVPDVASGDQAIVVTIGGVASNSGLITVRSSQHTTRFGSQAGHEQFADKEKEAGIGAERIWIAWNQIEPQKDSYTWATMDERVKKGNDAGIELLGYFTYTPDWAKKDPNCTADICAIKDMAEFRQLAKDVAERYDGKHGHGVMTYIEILNEVTLSMFFDGKNTDYRDWLINGYQGVKEGNPDAKVLIGGFVNPLSVKPFVENMLQNYNQYYDIVSFHVYEADAEVAAAATYLKEEMSLYNAVKPMWMTETATIPPATDLDWSKTVAKGVVKRYASGFGNGVERIYWWPFTGLPTPEEDPRYGSRDNKIVGLGWVYPKGSGMPIDQFHPRLAYSTYKLMTSKIAGFSSVQKITDSQYKFVVNGKNVYVLWSDTGGGSIPGGISGTVKITDFLGNVETKNANQLALTANPVFVEQ